MLLYMTFVLISVWIDGCNHILCKHCLSLLQGTLNNLHSILMVYYKWKIKLYFISKWVHFCHTSSRFNLDAANWFHSVVCFLLEVRAFQLLALLIVILAFLAVFQLGCSCAPGVWKGNLYWSEENLYGLPIQRAELTEQAGSDAAGGQIR